MTEENPLPTYWDEEPPKDGVLRFYKNRCRRLEFKNKRLKSLARNRYKKIRKLVAENKLAWDLVKWMWNERG